MALLFELRVTSGQQSAFASTRRLPQSHLVGFADVAGSRRVDKRLKAGFPHVACPGLAQLLCDRATFLKLARHYLMPSK